jgi:hypothetical protein
MPGGDYYLAGGIVFYAAAADANGGLYLGGRMNQAGDFGSGALRGHDAPLLLRIKP